MKTSGTKTGDKTPDAELVETLNARNAFKETFDAARIAAGVTFDPLKEIREKAKDAASEYGSFLTESVRDSLARAIGSRRELADMYADMLGVKPKDFLKDWKEKEAERLRELTESFAPDPNSYLEHLGVLKSLKGAGYIDHAALSTPSLAPMIASADALAERSAWERHEEQVGILKDQLAHSERIRAEEREEHRQATNAFNQAQAASRRSDTRNTIISISSLAVAVIAVVVAVLSWRRPVAPFTESRTAVPSAPPQVKAATPAVQAHPRKP